MIGEILDRVLTYGTPAFLIIKEMLERLAKNPELQKIATEKLLEVAKGGRGRVDEVFYIVSLITLPAVSEENKELFLQKHFELLHPDFTGKTPEEIQELRQKEKLAKGLIFLIAEDKTATDEKPSKRFWYARKIWYGIFLGADNLPDDNAKLQLFEQRILHFGKNHQERMSLTEAIEKIGPALKVLDGGASVLGDGISSAVNWIHRGYDEQTWRKEERARRRRDNWLNWFNPKLWLESFIDLT